MNRFLATLLLTATGALSACDPPISTNNQPITGDHPAAAADSVAPLDTLAPPAGVGVAPFVNPILSKRGRAIQHPSPPASRTQ